MSCISSHLKDAFHLCDNLWLPSKLDVTVVAHSGRRAKHFGMIVCLCLGAASRHFGQPTLDARLFSVDQIRRGIHGIWYIGQLKRSIKACSLLTLHRGGMIFCLFTYLIRIFFLRLLLLSMIRHVEVISEAVDRWRRL